MPLTLITCPHYESETAFLEASATAAYAQLGQAWVTEGEHPDFQGARVRYGWIDDKLLVAAELNGDAIKNTATTHNSRTWETGDAFEIFLRPAGGTRYFEFHVTPENIRLQLSIASAEQFFAPEFTDLPHDEWARIFTMPTDTFTSEAEVNHSAQRWTAFAAIPFKSLNIDAPNSGDEWTTCACRYNYPNGSQSAPVFSTTSTTVEPAFHDQTGWNTLAFSKSS